MSEVTTREAAHFLGVDQSRIRALIVAGTLDARRVGDRWLVDEAKLQRHRDLVAHGVSSRAMSSRVAWAAAALVDGYDTEWIMDTERSRIKRRVRNQAIHAGSQANTYTYQRWLSTRSTRVRRYRIAEQDLNHALASDHVVATGVSAAVSYNVGLSSAGHADAYVTAEALKRLVDEFFLIESDQGALTLREVNGDWHERSARPRGATLIAPRLMVGVDLADQPDRRSQSAGHSLIRSSLNDFIANIHADSHNSERREDRGKRRL